MKTASRVRKRKIDLDRVRSRLYQIVLFGPNREAIQAARVLLREDDAPGQPVNKDLLKELTDALKYGN